MSAALSRKGCLVLLALACGAALRLWFIHAYPEVQGDPLLYGDIAKNWMLHGIYGLSGGSGIHPTLIRLPGYPLFLVLCFRLFGIEHYHAVMYTQAVMDLSTCLLIAAFAKRVWNTSAAWWALWLAALCPFTANYAAIPLTETPELFFTALAFYSLARYLAFPRRRWLLLQALAWSGAALLRPDGALLALTLCPALIWYGRRRWGTARMLKTALFCGLLSVLPFVPWTLRNRHTFHVFQPLAPRYAVDPGESADPGFNRWTKTVCVDFACTWDVYWNAGNDVIDLHALPLRAFDSPQQYAETAHLLDAYNATLTLTPQLDARFAALAAERVRVHPFRCFVALPLARLADMWLRPRTEFLWIELRWWQFQRHKGETAFSAAYAALNLFFLAAAIAGLRKHPRLGGAMIAFCLLRSALLLTLEAPEPRYTLECFPVLLVLAAVAFARGTPDSTSAPSPSPAPHAA
ncbi:glycosyltransferase family 39 protein [Paracidobacterium acidisoli]|uniref:Glycosyltransferase RgtA/B/C/D-like domain-containing protein n=1 Tax=Paracidobacterium acidisoli TaxID=2303751 RepID=A0A372IKR8_9BACT|nr:glycosyltransferase family 39 protein [Paracidobacterium acidisoli]MBT9332895.1 glycosyltransferase family 39 protein [Paracidobacterium acidisoli]